MIIQENRVVSMANKRKYKEEKDTLSEGDDVEPDRACVHPKMEVSHDKEERKVDVNQEDRFGTKSGIIDLGNFTVFNPTSN